jgi:hypothetical protein
MMDTTWCMLKGYREGILRLKDCSLKLAKIYEIYILDWVPLDPLVGKQELPDTIPWHGRFLRAVLPCERPPIRIFPCRLRKWSWKSQSRKSQFLMLTVVHRCHSYSSVSAANSHFSTRFLHTSGHQYPESIFLAEPWIPVHQRVHDPPAFEVQKRMIKLACNQTEGFWNPKFRIREPDFRLHSSLRDMLPGRHSQVWR